MATADDAPRRVRGDVLALVACILAGLLLSLLPNLIWWPRHGAPVWIEDRDELVYLASSYRACRDRLDHLPDLVQKGDQVAASPWLQFMPFVYACRALNLGPMGITVLWRIWAGLAVAVGMYVLMRQFIARPWVAAALAIIAMADVGMIRSRPLIEQAGYTSDLIAGRTIWPAGDDFSSSTINNNWHVTSPAVIFGYLLIHLALLTRARNRPTRGNILASGVAFGLLFYVYFFYWTAAGLGLMLGLLLDAGRRRRTSSSAASAGWSAPPS